MEHPDISCCYKRSSFDKDTGWTETVTTIEQHGDGVVVTEVTTENGVETKREIEHGAITKTYRDEHLVQITLDNGRRVYYDVRKKELNRTLECVFRRSAFPGFDYRNPKHIRAVCLRLGQIRDLFADSIPPVEDSSVLWVREGDHIRGRFGEFLRLEVTLRSGDVEADWFGLWITVNGLPPFISIRSHVRREGDENWDLIVNAPPERHREVNALLDRVMDCPGA